MRDCTRNSSDEMLAAAGQSAAADESVVMVLRGLGMDFETGFRKAECKVPDGRSEAIFPG